jgi:hypothetical protein
VPQDHIHALNYQPKDPALYRVNAIAIRENNPEKVKDHERFRVVRTDAEMNSIIRALAGGSYNRAA